MKLLLRMTAVCAMSLACAAHADDRPLLVRADMIDIDAEPAAVWNIVKDFDGLATWLPLFAATPLVKGRNGQPGAVRAIVTKDGTSFTEELLAYDEAGRVFTYNVIESPLPIDHYQSSLAVGANPKGGTTVAWIGTWKRKNPRDNPPAAETDGATLDLIRGAYRLGLETLKKLAEAR